MKKNKKMAQKILIDLAIDVKTHMMRSDYSMGKEIGKSERKFYAECVLFSLYKELEKLQKKNIKFSIYIK